MPMSSDQARINIEGALEIVKKSKNPLTPIYEAMTNSLESIAQIEKPQKDSEIVLRLFFEPTTDQRKRLLSSVEIEDSGTGFTKSNLDRFKEFFDKSKGFDNRGSGRLQFLHRFSTVEVESVSRESQIPKGLSFTCDKTNFISNEKQWNETNKSSSPKTIVTLKNPILNKKENLFYNNLDIETLTNEIRNHFLLRFYLDSKKTKFGPPKIRIQFIEDTQEERIISSENIQFPESEGQIQVPYIRVKTLDSGKIEWIRTSDFEVLHWAKFKTSEQMLSKNSIYLCSKNIPVQALNLLPIKKGEHIDGYRYQTVFYGDILDKAENVSDAVDAFKFPHKKDVTFDAANDLFFEDDQPFILMDEITNSISNELPIIHKELQKLKASQDEAIANISALNGISPEIALKSNISLTDDDETITKKLYVRQAEHLAQQGNEVKIIYESLRDLNPIETGYSESLQDKIERLNALVDKQNKEELSRYVIRREMVSKILGKILNNELSYQKSPAPKGKRKSPEGLIHDLIFKRKTNSNIHNDLWILNEEYLHFEGCSDLPLTEIVVNGIPLLREVTAEQIEKFGVKLDRRPDIFLFPQEGQCVLIELKAPNVDLSEHTTQLLRYCNLISNLATNPINRFFCYLIGEKFNEWDLNEYHPTVSGDFIKNDIPIKKYGDHSQVSGSAQVEIIKLSSLVERAHKRNQSFAEKLGLPELLKTASLEL